MLFVLKAFKYQVALLIFKLFYSVFSAHVVEVTNFEGHQKFLVNSRLLLHCQGLVGLHVVRQKHVCTQIQNCSLIYVEVFIINHQVVWLIWILLEFAVVFHELADAVGEVDVRLINCLIKFFTLVHVTQTDKHVHENTRWNLLLR